MGGRGRRRGEKKRPESVCEGGAVGALGASFGPRARPCLSHAHISTRAAAPPLRRTGFAFPPFFPSSPSSPGAASGAPLGLFPRHPSPSPRSRVGGSRPLAGGRFFLWRRREAGRRGGARKRRTGGSALPAVSSLTAYTSTHSVPPPQCPVGGWTTSVRKQQHWFRWWWKGGRGGTQNQSCR